MLKKLTQQREDLTEERNRLKVSLRETVKRHGVKVETQHDERVKQQEAWRGESAEFDKKIAQLQT